MERTSAGRQLDTFLRRFSPEIVKLAKAARARFRKRLPRAIEMVYDNYNALVIGYSPTERKSEVRGARCEVLREKPCIRLTPARPSGRLFAAIRGWRCPSRSGP